jgi:hypothetical protein
MSDVRGKSATAMSRTKKPSKLSADERAFLNRIHSLNEEETEKLTIEEIIAYYNIMHKIDPRLVRHAFEETFIDRGLTNSEVLRLLERAKERASRRHPAARSSLIRAAAGWFGDHPHPIALARNIVDESLH